MVGPGLHNKNPAASVRTFPIDLAEFGGRNGMGRGRVPGYPDDKRAANSAPS